jgi:hypothetical protein
MPLKHSRCPCASKEAITDILSRYNIEILPLSLDLTEHLYSLGYFNVWTQPSFGGSETVARAIQGIPAEFPEWPARPEWPVRPCTTSWT